jgi:ADP-ribosylation factor-like protein 13B
MKKKKSKNNNQNKAPSVGFKSFPVEKGAKKLRFYDVGGGKRIRPIWKNYYGEVHGFVFVVDSADRARLAEAREVLERELVSEHMAGKALVVFANKQDVPGAATPAEIADSLALESLCRANNVTYTLVGGQAKPSGSAAAAHPSVAQAYDWLMKNIGLTYAEVHAKVVAHVTAAEEAKRKQKADAQRRLEEIRAKRLKEEAEEKERAAREAAGSKEPPPPQANAGNGAGAAAGAAGGAAGSSAGPLPPLNERRPGSAGSGAVRAPATLPPVTPLPPIHAGIPGQISSPGDQIDSVV